MAQRSEPYRQHPNPSRCERRDLEPVRSVLCSIKATNICCYTLPELHAFPLSKNTTAYYTVDPQFCNSNPLLKLTPCPLLAQPKRHLRGRKRRERRKRRRTGRRKRKKQERPRCKRRATSIMPPKKRRKKRRLQQERLRKRPIRQRKRKQRLVSRFAASISI